MIMVLLEFLSTDFPTKLALYYIVQSPVTVFIMYSSYPFLSYVFVAMVI